MKNTDWKIKLSDEDIVLGIQCNDERVEELFYKSCYRYFTEMWRVVFLFTADSIEPKDLFQDAFIVLWSEIQTGKIHLRDGMVCRYDVEGKSRVMKASLTTYLMSIAKYRNSEISRQEDIYADEPLEDATEPEEEAPEITVEGILTLMVNDMPRRCREILTLFYYEGKSLDEILSVRRENASKDGLKSAKSKCMSQLKRRVVEECRKYHLKSL